MNFKVLLTEIEVDDWSLKTLKTILHAIQVNFEINRNVSANNDKERNSNLASKQEKGVSFNFPIPALTILEIVEHCSKSRNSFSNNKINELT